MSLGLPFYPDDLVIHHTCLLNASCIDQNFFIAPFDCEVLYATCSQSTPDTDVGTVTVQLRKCNSGTAPASGTALFSSAQSVKTTANTPVAPTLVFSQSTRTLKQFASLALDFTGVTDLAGFNITVYLRRTTQSNL